MQVNVVLKVWCLPVNAQVFPSAKSVLRADADAAHSCEWSERAEGTEVGLMPAPPDMLQTHGLFGKLDNLRGRPRVYWGEKGVGGQEVVGK